MNYAEALNMFMEAKKEQICRDIGVEPYVYYNHKDRKYLKRMSQKKAKKIWEELTESILFDEARALGTNTCPFCFELKAFPDCKDCRYRAHHKDFRCGDKGSGYMEILATSYRGMPYKDYIAYSLTNLFYRTLIKKIEMDLW